MIGFVVIALAMALLVVAIVARAIQHANLREPVAQNTADVAVYRAQLDELERDVARGILSQSDAKQAHTEIARRLLNIDAQTEKTPTPERSQHWLIAMVAVFLIGGSGALYWQIGAAGYGDMSLANRKAFAEELRKTRPSQAVALASLPPEEIGPEVPAETKALLLRLRQAMMERPDDILGQQLLSNTEASIGNYAAAATAQETLIRLQGDTTSVEEVARLGELLVLAAGGYVSPEAELSLRAAYAQDRSNPTARYYLGLMLVQTGRPDLGFGLWDGLLREGPEDAPWIAPITAQIMAVAQLAGVKYALPQIGPGRGPSVQDIENAAEMTPEDRMQMIEGMVAGLSDRLASGGGPPEEWARLITALGVLGRRKEAAAIYANAVEVFGTDPGAMDIINRAGERAGVAG